MARIGATRWRFSPSLLISISRLQTSSVLAFVLGLAASLSVLTAAVELDSALAHSRPKSSLTPITAVGAPSPIPTALSDERCAELMRAAHMAPQTPPLGPPDQRVQSPQDAIREYLGSSVVRNSRVTGCLSLTPGDLARATLGRPYRVYGIEQAVEKYREGMKVRELLTVNIIEYMPDRMWLYPILVGGKERLWATVESPEAIPPWVIVDVYPGAVARGVDELREATGDPNAEITLAREFGGYRLPGLYALVSVGASEQLACLSNCPQGVGVRVGQLYAPQQMFSLIREYVDRMCSAGHQTACGEFDTSPVPAFLGNALLVLVAVLAVGIAAVMVGIAWLVRRRAPAG